MRALGTVISYVSISLLIMLVSSLATATQSNDPAETAAEALETTEVFGRYAGAVAKIQIVGSRSESKSTIGSGFFVEHSGSNRHLVTNYHVISQALLDPESHRIERVDEDGEAHALAVVAVDVVHDLALLSGTFDSPVALALAAETPQQGTRIYSLGHPHDLPLTIVEGTINRLLGDDFLGKIHLTASINSGMSGGPTILANGTVIGINVQTAGNQVGFVIPASEAVRMTGRAAAPGYRVNEDLTDEVRLQLLAHQDAFFADVLALESFETRPMGPFDVPSDFASFLDCWGQDSDDATDLFESTLRSCSMRDEIFLENGITAGAITVEHHYLSTEQLGPFRFYTLYQSLFDSGFYGGYGHTEDLTDYVCETAYVESPASTEMNAGSANNAGGANGEALVLKAVFCARRYVKLAELYDVVFKVATLGDDDRGLSSRMSLSGVSFENGRGLAQRFLRSIKRRAE